MKREEGRKEKKKRGGEEERQLLYTMALECHFHQNKIDTYLHSIAQGGRWLLCIGQRWSLCLYPSY